MPRLSCIAVVGLLSLTRVAHAQAARATEPPHATRRASPTPVHAAPSRYLYVWAGTDSTDSAQAAAAMGAPGVRSDFLAVIDLAPEDSGARYGRVIATVPVGATHTMPHHAEQVFAAGHRFFVSGYMSGQLFTFDVTDRAHPRFETRIDSVPGYWRPHSLARLPNGHVVVTVQFGPASAPGRPGAIAELDDEGHVVRLASSADPKFPGLRIRTYGLAVAPAIDRIITTSAPMDDERVADVVQVWRLSDFRLLRTIALPERSDSASREPFEARVLADGRTALVNTYRCGFYRLLDLETLAPRAAFVHSLQRRGARNGCSVPVVVGHYWVMPIAYQHRVVVLDVSHPDRPREVASLASDSTFFPHWSAADPRSDRIVISEQGDGLPRVLIARLEQRSGQLRWDERFRDAGAARPGLSFSRDAWPDGSSGAAMPHGAIFVPEP